MPNTSSTQDYYAFGSPMAGRTHAQDLYKFGFNGKENDGETSTQDYGMRIYNPALGKFLSVDPLTKDYPFYTPYQFGGNKPIWAVDLDGKEEYYTSQGELIGKFGDNTEIKIVYDDYVSAAIYITAQQNNKTPELDILNNILYNKGSASVYSSPEDAAKNWGTINNQNSIDKNVELNSFIFYTNFKGRNWVSTTKPKEGTEAHSENY